MASIRELKRRITSVKETKKITQAMKMVSAAKYKKAVQQMNAARQYLSGYEQIYQELCARLEQSLLLELFPENPGKPELILVITGDRGLCGSFNANVLKAAETYAKSQTGALEFCLIGNKGVQYFKSRKWRVSEQQTGFMDKFSIAKAAGLIMPIFEKYKAGDYSKVWLFNNKFKTVVTSTVSKKQLLPLEIREKDETSSANDYMYEPSSEEVISKLFVKYLVSYVQTAFLESTAGEEGSRMAAMEAATDNAEDMLHQLTLQYNQSRQAAITKELSEIVGGAEALAHD